MSGPGAVHVVAASPAARGQIVAACHAHGLVEVVSAYASLSEVDLEGLGPTVLVMPTDDLLDADAFAGLAGFPGLAVTIVLVGGRARSPVRGVATTPITLRILPTDGSRQDLHRKLEDALALPPSAEGGLAQPQFSIQEVRALQLYASGLTLAEVAAQMGVKVTTAKEYVQRVRQKYDAVGRPAPTKLHLHINAQQDGLLGA